MPEDNEDERLRSVALQNAQSIVLARRRAEEDLRKQSEWLRVTLASIGDAVISTDAEGRITFMNGVAESLTGWALAEAKGHPLPDVFHIVNEHNRETVDNPALRVLREGAVIGLANHTVLVARDGTEWPIDDSAAPIRDDAGEVVGVVLVFRDISERKQAGEALHRNERDLSDFFENAPLGLRWAGPDGVIQRVNQAELDLLGYTRDEYVGRPVADFHVDPVVIDEFFSRLAQGETVRDFPSRMRCKNGAVKDVLMSSNALFENGEFVHTRSFTLDITDRKRAEESLREGEKRLRFIMDSMPQMIYTADPAGELNYVNPRWSEFSGFNFDRLKGWDWAQIVHPDDLIESTAVWERSFDTGDEFRIELRFRRWDGEYFWHLSQATPLRDDRGQVMMWVGSTTDIHEQREAATRLRRLAADLSEADHRKNEFIAMLAHELRNPLAPIHTSLQIVRRSGGNSDAINSAAEVMERQVSHLVRLVDDLLDVNRISRGRIELRCERIELASAINHAVETCRSALEHSRQELTLDLPGEPVYVHADPIRLTQVFSNLLNNACKYTDPGGRISISAELKGPEVLVSVRDNGVGIPPEMLNGIFELFAQVDRTVERSHGGLGIGLSLAKELVELHGGGIEVHSAGHGQGSEFVVRLPVLTGAHPPVIPPPAVAAAVPAKSRRILVVDDNRDAAQSLAVLLQVFGHETCIAYDGLEAMAAAAAFGPEVVLLDIGLPGLNGFEAAQKMREQPWGQDLVLVALTGWGQDEDRQRSHEAGFNHHLVKPVDHEALLGLLAGL